MTITVPADAPRHIEGYDLEDVDAFIESLEDACYQAAHRNGWHKDYPQRDQYDDDKAYLKAHLNWTIAKLFLIVDEACEGGNELRSGRAATDTYYKDERPGPLTGRLYTEQLWLDGVPQYKPEGLPSELADILIRTFDLAGVLGINLGQAVVGKLLYNARRGERHGGRAF